MSQTLSFDAYYADYKIAATNAGLPVLEKALIYFAFEAGLTVEDAAEAENKNYLEAQHTAFTDSEGYSLKENPHRLDKVLEKLAATPSDEDEVDDFEDEEIDDEEEMRTIESGHYVGSRDEGDDDDEEDSSYGDQRRRSYGPSLSGDEDDDDYDEHL